MTGHGFDPSRRVEVVRADVPYLRHGEDELLARVWQPAVRISNRRVAIVDVHGGAWCDNDRRFGKRYDIVLASCGVVVVAIDFRCGASGPHPAGSTDVATAVRWVRANAAELGVDPDLILSVGSSSGGHLAWLAALGPRHIDPAPAGEIMVEGSWVPAGEGNDGVLGVEAFWPPLDPLARYRYASGLDTDHGRRLVANTEAYFGGEEAMAEASVAHTVRSGHHSRLPKVLLVVPENDLNVPPAITDEAAAVYREAGGDIEVRDYPGVGHGFGHLDTEQTPQFDADVLEWVSRVVAEVSP